MNDYKHFWKTKDGKIIPYKLMTTEHLNNTYDMLAELEYEFKYTFDFAELPAYVYDAMRAIEKELESREQKDSK